MNDFYQALDFTLPGKRVSYRIGLYLPLLKHKKYPNEPVQADLGVFDSDPGLQRGDWIYISNYLIKGERLDFRARVTERRGLLTRKGNIDESIFEMRILVEAEDKRITDKIAETFKNDPDLC